MDTYGRSAAPFLGVRPGETRALSRRDAHTSEQQLYPYQREAGNRRPDQWGSTARITPQPSKAQRGDARVLRALC